MSFWLVIGSFTVGAGVVLIRDYSKFRRQKAVIDAAKEMFTFIKYGGELSEWKTRTKTDSISLKGPSKKQSIS